MTNDTKDSSPQVPKGHINQNLLIAIIGAVATLVAAILPWALDRAAQTETTPTAIQTTFTASAPFDATVTSTVVAAPSATLTPTLESPAQNGTSTEETGVYNAYLAFDFSGKFLETNFNQGQTIYVFFNLNDPQDRNIVRVIVSVVDVPGVLEGTQRYNTINEFTDPKNLLVISDGKLSPGKYKVDVYLNNTLDETLEFTIIE